MPSGVPLRANPPIRSISGHRRGRRNFKHWCSRARRCAGPSCRQRTLARSAVLYGQGLHSGKKSGLIFEPLGSRFGIHFIGVSDNRAVPRTLISSSRPDMPRRSASEPPCRDHRACHVRAQCLRVSNLLIKCNGEVPVLDGSSVEFCSLFEEVGFENQIGDWHGILVKEPIRIDAGRASIRLEPCDAFEIDYNARISAPVGKQRLRLPSRRSRDLPEGDRPRPNLRVRPGHRVAAAAGVGSRRALRQLRPVRRGGTDQRRPSLSG